MGPSGYFEMATRTIRREREVVHNRGYNLFRRSTIHYCGQKPITQSLCRSQQRKIQFWLLSGVGKEMWKKLGGVNLSSVRSAKMGPLFCHRSQCLRLPHLLSSSTN